MAFLTPTRARCGIADYARHLLAHLGSQVDLIVVPLEAARRRADYARLGARLTGADVAHLQYEHGFFLHGGAPGENLEALLGGIAAPKLLTLHCLPFDDPASARCLADRSTSCLVHSAVHRRQLAGRAAGRVVVAPIPVGRRRRGACTSAEIRRRYGLAGRTVLTIFGFIKWHKGYEVALDALAALPERCTLLIAGGPQDARDREVLAGVRARAHALGLAERVVVSGYLPEAEVGATMCASDLVLAPFTAMTASGSLSAALAWGRPVLAADLPQMAELHRAWRAPALFATGSARDLARRALRLLEDRPRRTELGRAARGFAREHTYRALAARHVELYARLAGGGAPSRRA